MEICGAICAREPQHPGSHMTTKEWERASEPIKNAEINVAPTACEHKRQRAKRVPYANVDTLSCDDCGYVIGVDAGLVAAQHETILQEAQRLISGARREAYGPAQESFCAIAKMWSGIMGIKITARQVALCMVAFKVCREVNKHGRDNLVDICGYAALANEVE